MFIHKDKNRKCSKKAEIIDTTTRTLHWCCWPVDKKPKMRDDQKRCVMTKKGFEGIKAVAGSYLGLLSSVCILSWASLQCVYLIWPSDNYSANFVATDLPHHCCIPSKDISPLSHTRISFDLIKQIFAYLEYYVQTSFHAVTISFWYFTIIGHRKWNLTPLCFHK